MGMTVSLAVVGVAMGVIVAPSEPFRRSTEGLGATETWREVTVRPLVWVRMSATPVAMRTSCSGGAVHPRNGTNARFCFRLKAEVAGARRRAALAPRSVRSSEKRIGPRI